MRKGKSPEIDETQGFGCLGHSNCTICSLLSHICSDRARRKYLATQGSLFSPSLFKVSLFSALSSSVSLCLWNLPLAKPDIKSHVMIYTSEERSGLLFHFSPRSKAICFVELERSGCLLILVRVPPFLRSSEDGQMHSGNFGKGGQNMRALSQRKLV